MICRRLIKRTLKYLGTEKELTTIELLGYSPSQLKETIESKFVDGMSWSNYGNKSSNWVIDHIFPLGGSKLRLSLQEVLYRLHYSNTQPLWWSQNAKKSWVDDSDIMLSAGRKIKLIFKRNHQKTDQYCKKLFQQSKTFYCDVCQHTYSKYYETAHNKSNKHKKNIN
jgi:hypothetical protein